MLGIIGAMDQEVNILKEKMEVKKIDKRASMEFYVGILNGKDVVIVKCGVGKVNAAVCTQILADCYQVEAVINTGVAGSLRAEINIGDIVVSTDALQHDMDATGFGYEPAEIPLMGKKTFEADASLRSLIAETCREVNPEIGVFEGRVVSGDQFISDGDVKDRLVRMFAPYCTEMEGAAIAQAAWLNQIPFVIIRAISDKADGSAHMDYSEFEAKAIEHTVRLVEAASCKACIGIIPASIIQSRFDEVLGLWTARSEDEQEKERFRQVMLMNCKWQRAQY